MTFVINDTHLCSAHSYSAMIRVMRKLFPRYANNKAAQLFSNYISIHYIYAKTLVETPVQPICFFFHGLKMIILDKKKKVEDVLKPPGSLLATDCSKAVVLV